MEIAHGADAPNSNYIVVIADNQQDFDFAKLQLKDHLKFEPVTPIRYPSEVRFDVRTDSKGTAKLTLQLISDQQQRIK